MEILDAAMTAAGTEANAILQDHPAIWHDRPALKLLGDHLGFKSVLVPLDGSTFSEWSLPLAVAIARKSRASLTLLHAWDPAPYFRTGDISQKYDDIPEVVASKEYLRDVSENLLGAADLRVRTEVVVGASVRAVEKHLMSADVDLIVMTTHGRTGVSRLWLGSFADAIVRSSTVPVLLWKTSEIASRPAADRMFSHILVPLNGAAPAEDMLPHAFRMGNLFGARYTLLQVVQPVTIPTHPYPVFATAWEPDPGTTQLAVANAEVYMSDLGDRLRRLYPGVKINTEVIIDDNPASAILRTASDRNVDLVAMATQARRGVRFLLGSVADKVLRGTRCPIMMALPS